MLTKSSYLAVFVWQVDDRVAFSYGDEDAPEFYYMDAGMWADMGKPETITIIVTPELTPDLRGI